MSQRLLKTTIDRKVPQLLFNSLQQRIHVHFAGEMYLQVYDGLWWFMMVYVFLYIM